MDRRPWLGGAVAATAAQAGMLGAGPGGATVALLGRMRLVVVIVSVVLLSLPAAARPRKRAHPRARPAPVTHVVPNDRAAAEHARAEAELSDLRAGRVSDDAAPAEPAQVWAIQENDRETPANLRQKK